MRSSLHIYIYKSIMIIWRSIIQRGKGTYWIILPMREFSLSRCLICGLRFPPLVLVARVALLAAVWVEPSPALRFVRLTFFNFFKILLISVYLSFSLVLFFRVAAFTSGSACQLIYYWGSGRLAVVYLRIYLLAQWRIFVRMLIDALLYKLITLLGISFL